MYQYCKFIHVNIMFLFVCKNKYPKFQYIYIYIYIKPDGTKEQILSIFYITKAFLLTNLQSVTKIIFLQKIFLFKQFEQLVTFSTGMI